jgi:radical SAM superfamily enzyme with C-terminal helix-hairpin-helix motif
MSVIDAFSFNNLKCRYLLAVVLLLQALGLGMGSDSVPSLLEGINLIHPTFSLG